MAAGRDTSRRWLFIVTATLTLCVVLATTGILLAWQQIERTRRIQSDTLRREAEQLAQDLEADMWESLRQHLFKPMASAGDFQPLAEELIRHHEGMAPVFRIDPSGIRWVPDVPPDPEPLPPLDTAPIWYLEARQVEINQRRPKDAIPLYERCLSPATPPVWQHQARLAIARCHRRLGDPSKALGAYASMLDEAAPYHNRLEIALAYLDTLEAVDRTESQRERALSLVQAARSGELPFQGRADVERFLLRVDRLRMAVDRVDLDQHISRHVDYRRTLEFLRIRLAPLQATLTRADSPDAVGPHSMIIDTPDVSIPLVWTRFVTGSGSPVILGSRLEPEHVLAPYIRPLFARQPHETLELHDFEAGPAASPEWSVPISEASPQLALVPSSRHQTQLKRSTRIQRLVSLVLTLATMSAVVAALMLALRSIRRDLELARLQNEFIAGVSHELKTPLALIRMYGETLRDGRVTDPDKREHYHTVIARESERLTGMIDTLLDFASTRQTHRPHVPQPCDPADILSRLRERFEEYLQCQGFTAFWEASERLPTIHADRAALLQALSNLIDNGVKYAAEQKSIIVRAACSDDRRHVWFEVRDHGIGIQDAERDMLTQPFFRSLDDRVQRIRGSGLGLAYVRHIVEAHRGTLTFISHPDGGTTARIAIPVAEGSAETQSPITDE